MHRAYLAIGTLYQIGSSIDVFFIALRNAKLMRLFNKIRPRNRSHFYSHPASNDVDNDVEWVRKVSRASGDLVSILVRKKEKERDGRERERKPFV